MIDINCPMTHTPKLTAGAALVVAHAIGRMLLVFKFDGGAGALIGGVQ